MFVTRGGGCSVSFMLRGTGVLAALAVAVLSVGCRTAPPGPPKKPAVPVTVYEHAKWAELPGWGTDNVQEAWRAFLESCRRCGFRRSGWRRVRRPRRCRGTRRRVCGEYFERAFEPYKIVRLAEAARGGGVRRGRGTGCGYGAGCGRGSGGDRAHHGVL